MDESDKQVAPPSIDEIATFGEGPADYSDRNRRALRVISGQQVELGKIALLDRGRQEMGNLTELRDSLDRYGQIHPILIRKPKPEEMDAIEGKRYVLVAGGRRYAAAAMLGWDSIATTMLEDMPRWKQRQIELEENIRRKSMTYDEEVAMKLEVHELYKEEASAAGKEWTQNDTARVLGESSANLSRDLKLAEEIKKNPTLGKASSKKAAVRAVKLQEHVKQLEANKEIDTSSLRERLVTARAEVWLKTLPDASVDLLFTDPPYGIGYDERPTGVSQGISRYDDSRETSLELLRAVVPDMLRVTKPSGWLVIFMNWELYNELKELMQCCCTAHYNYGPLAVDITPHGTSRVTFPKACPSGSKSSPCSFIRAEELPWVWHRPNSRNNPEYPELHAQNRYELIMVINRGAARLIASSFRQVPNVRVYDADYSERIHAMEKPLALCSDLVEEFSLVGQLVVDPFFGSGKLLMGAGMLGRDFRGCDQNPELLESAIASIAPYWSGSQVATGDSDTSTQGDDDEAEQ